MDISPVTRNFLADPDVVCEKSRVITLREAILTRANRTDTKFLAPRHIVCAADSGNSTRIRPNIFGGTLT